MNDQALFALAARCGFDHFGALPAEAMEFDPAVRDMCAADRCRSYGRRWSCPPGCGTLEEIAAKASAYHWGILLQSTGEMEDDFDVEAMMDTEKLHKQRFFRFVEEVRKAFPDCLPMASGACQLCRECTYPDAPCRFPEKAIPSMEAYGLMVSRVCERSGLPYYYGPRTITYTACVLVE